MASGGETSSDKPQEFAIGIDLGTTFSCAAVVKDGKIQVIANELGYDTTPSFVAFTDYGRLVGQNAEKQMIIDPKNTVFDVKRLIGRKFSDAIVQNDMKYWPFNVVQVGEMPAIQVTDKGQELKLFAEQISSMVLGKLKDAAEKFLDAPVKNAVVTVPAYFNDMQRKATRDAATIAGLKVLCIINEPTAAAIAYGLSTSSTQSARNVLVYDLGGGTFDVTILSINANIYEVKATGGDTHLGGEDFNKALMQGLAEEFEQKHGIDVSQNKDVMRKLYGASETTKRELSALPISIVCIENLINGITFKTEVSQGRFEKLCYRLFKSTIDVVNDTLNDAKLTKDDIDKVVLVGGSTRIPKIQKLLSNHFGSKISFQGIHTDHAVAHGAAIKAAIMQGHATAEMQQMELKEVTALTLGLRAGFRDEMNPVIARNSSIPCSRTQTCATKSDNQTLIRIGVLQGEHKSAKDNFEIGNFIIDNIPKAPAHAEKLTVTFTIDANGILTVSAISNSNRQSKGELTVKNVSGSLTADEIELMIDQSKKFREEDQQLMQRVTERAELEKFVYDVLAEHGSNNETIKTKCDEVLLWLSKCHRPTQAELLEKKEELVGILFGSDSEPEPEPLPKPKRKRKWPVLTGRKRRRFSIA